MKYAILSIVTVAIVSAIAIKPAFAAKQASARQDVLNTVHAVGYYADRNQWDQVAAQFHPKGAVLDYTSYATASAGTSAELKPLLPQQIIDAWQTVLPGYDLTHHMISSEVVDIQGNQADVKSNVYATHLLQNDQGEDYWVFLGDYHHKLQRTADGWKITYMQANLRGQQGNPELPNLAIEVVKQRDK